MFNYVTLTIPYEDDEKAIMQTTFALLRSHGNKKMQESNTYLNSFFFQHRCFKWDFMPRNMFSYFSIFNYFYKQKKKKLFNGDILYRHACRIRYLY